MATPELALAVQRHSTATHMRKLAREVQDGVIDAWLTPQAQQLTSERDHLRTRVQIALAPTLLRNLSERDGPAALYDLTTWLVTHHVEYVIGYRTSQQQGKPFHNVQIAVLRHGAGVAPNVVMPLELTTRKLQNATKFAGSPTP